MQLQALRDDNQVISTKSEQTACDGGRPRDGN